MDKLNSIEHKLVVSCQALPDEPLHSSFIMARMARAAKEGGAAGIRANTVPDIAAIQEEVDLPVIGIIKRDYEDSDIYITPTMKEVDELMIVKPEVIAMDATNRLRPGNETLDDFFARCKAKYPDQIWMADCSTVEEALHADELGFDIVSTTLVGYTPESENLHIEDEDFQILKDILKDARAKVIAEGNIDTPEKARRVLELGCFSVVVGSIITRPQVITKRFTSAIDSLSPNGREETI